VDTTLQQISNAVKKIPIIETDIKNLKAQTPAQSNGHYTVLKTDNTGSNDVTDAIIAANNAAITNKTYQVVFPFGEYWIKPDRITIPEGVEWISYGDAILFTKETSLYNVVISVKSNVKITNLKFTQMRDSAMTPSSQTGKGMHILHVSNANNVTIRDCTFYASGVTAIIVQNQQLYYGYDINIERNNISFQRKIDLEFDVSLIYVDAMSGKIKDNNIESVKTYLANGWKAETGIEVHSPNMLIENNTVTGCVNGILPTAWGSLYPTFDDTFRGRLMITHNTLINVVRGISYWGAPIANMATTARNVFIINNYINLRLEKRPKSGYYYPTEGIGLEDHSSSTAAFYFKNIQIRSNRIETTYEAGLNPKALMNYGPAPAPQLGAVNMQTKYSCEHIDISDNDIDFPMPTFNLKASGNAVHKNIRIYDNRLINPAIYHAYLSNGFDGVYNLENINGLDAWKNSIYGTPIELMQKGANVSNISIM